MVKAHEPLQCRGFPLELGAGLAVTEPAVGSEGEVPFTEASQSSDQHTTHHFPPPSSRQWKH